MSPDLDWRIGEDAEQETVAKTAPCARSRWHSFAVMLVACAGVGLGIVYASIPEPPRPMPAPTMTPPPVQSWPVSTDDQYASYRQLVTVIDREAQALADGDPGRFMAVQDSTDRDWLQAQQSAFSRWGRPPVEHYASLYFFSGLAPADLKQGHAWIDIRQWRDNGYFRETRFYRQIGHHWMRTRPDWSLWRGDRRTLISRHFELSLPEADEPFARTLLERFEAAYTQLCVDLMCSDETITATAKIALSVRPENDHNSWIELGSRVTISLPSPRVSGLIDDDRGFDRRDPLTDIAYRRLLEVTARLAAGGLDRWRQSQAGGLFVAGVMQWELDRLSGGRDTDVEALLRPDLLRGRKLTLPKYLWDWPVRDSRRLAAPQAQANSVVVFIDRTFGAPSVIKFLKAIGDAASLPQAIEASVPMSYDHFEKQWQTWLDRQLKGEGDESRY